jgi:hypothetical protein
VPLTKTDAPGKGAPVSPITVPEIASCTDTKFNKGSFILKNTSLSISLENTWGGLAQNPAKMINHAETRMSLENRNFENIKSKYLSSG